MPDQPIRIYHANDRIPRRDLVKAYILHQLVPTNGRDYHWFQDQRLMRASLNHTSELVHDGVGKITVPQ